ncbi:MAG: Mpo1-like protein [Pyrinomonadaceae bacterium]
MNRITNYNEFWDFYVSEHSKPMTRYFHFVGTLLGIVMLFWFLQKGAYFKIPLCFVVGYGFAWFSHFFIEKNKPATFKYPLWSFISDYKMLAYMLTGKMNREVERVVQK